MRKNQSGFAVLPIILVVVVVAIIGFTGWYVIHANAKASDTYNSATETSNNVGPKYSKDKKSTSGKQSSATDAVTETNLASTQTQLEAYFATNNTYPTLAELNSSSWRSQNMPNATTSGFSPDSNTNPQLVASQPTASSFAYSVTPDSCAGTATSPCTGYTLSALVGGQVESKHALN